MAGIGEGNGHGKGLVDVQEIGDDCILVIPNPQKPPPQNELHVTLADVMQKWLAQHPVRVRATLPITNQGQTVALFVWFDRRETTAE